MCVGCALLLSPGCFFHFFPQSSCLQRFSFLVVGSVWSLAGWVVFLQALYWCACKMRSAAIATGTEVLQNMQVRRGGVGRVCLGLFGGGAHINRTMASVTA